MTGKDVINGLTRVLLVESLTAGSSAAIGAAIDYLQGGFFNEDASREIDRLTLMNEQKDEIIAEQQQRIYALERGHACA